ncbi:hypothetical protein tinsulaeT_32660 [Thalassotalea insulae]|uniref:DUF904 domain-containing protein n=1 Tax=Thalassotalea insulae TaxID=2056778 RepID=A0ABQ6H0E1_9GAMM|nr:hypothetical protein tinsulaeT_32660 [Thalassotalea insulae]
MFNKQKWQNLKTKAQKLLELMSMSTTDYLIDEVIEIHRLTEEISTMKIQITRLQNRVNQLERNLV